MFRIGSTAVLRPLSMLMTASMWKAELNQAGIPDAITTANGQEQTKVIVVFRAFSNLSAKVTCADLFLIKVNFNYCFIGALIWV